MATSKIPKRTRAVRRVASGTGVGGGSTRLQLNRDWLISEHKFNFSVSQANTGIDPTSVDVRDFIDSFSIETSDGRRVFLTGAQMYDLARYTEKGSATVSALGATSTATWSAEVHYENDEALLDLLTALRSNELSTLDAVIVWAADATNGFKGGTAPAAAAYTVTVDSYDYQMLTDKPYGVLLGSAKHYAEKLGSKSGSSAGSQADWQLITGNTTRFIMLHTYDTTGAVPVLSNSILGNVRLNINGRDHVVSNGRAIQDDNNASRGIDLTGVYVLDFGDDELGFLNIQNVQQALLQWEVAAGAPAGWRVDLAQDYTRGGQQ